MGLRASADNAAERERGAQSDPAPGVDGRAPAERILALQRTAGNAAVGRLLRTPSTTAAPSTSVTSTVEKGALSPAIERTSTDLLKEDLLVVKAKVTGLKTPSDSVIAVALSPGMTIESGGWQGTTYVWRIRATSIGTFPLVISMVGGVNESETLTVNIRSDADDQLRAIVQAQAILTRRFAEAEKKLAEAGLMFGAAFRRHEQDLKDVENGERIDKELMWGLVFAALGGFAGGIAGALGKRALDAFGGKDFSKSIPGEAFTDLGKDSVKYAVRTQSKTVPSVTGDSTAPGTLTQPPKSDRKPVEPAPLTFYQELKAALEAEKIEAFSHLETVIDALRKQTARSSKVLFDEDPTVWASKRDVLIDTIAERLETSELRYYEALWGAWVKTFYYPIVDTGAMQRSGRRYMVSYFPRSSSLRLTYLLRDVAKTCGYPDMQAFLEKYGDRRAKEKEADRLNAEFWEQWKAERGWR